MTNVAICGANGKMGKTIYSCIKDREDCRVVAGIDLYTEQYADFPIVDAPSKLPVKPDVIIDFSNPACLDALLEYCLSTGTPIAGANGDTLVSEAFGQYFGQAGTWFVAIAMLFFAFTTVLGWSQYGSKAVEYLFGAKGVKVYKFIFVAMIVSGAVMEGGLAWDLSDTFNGLMMIPNLIGVIALFPLVIKITKNYIDRRINNKDVAPIISYDPEIQAELENELDKD